MTRPFSREELAEGARGQGVAQVPAAIHIANCAKVRALIADQPDAADLADMLGLDATMPAPVTRSDARHFRAHLLPAALTMGRMI